MRQLNQAAIKFLVDKGGIPERVEVQVLVRIYPDDKTKMCELYYDQGFGKAAWQVTIGYDGKIQDYKRRIKEEATDPILPK